MGRRTSTLTAMALAVVAVGLLALGIDFLPVRLFFGVLLVFVLPGVAVVNALFAKRPLGGPERVILILAVSLGCTLAGALLLNLLVVGLQPVAWAGLSAAITLVFGVVHLARPGADRVAVAGPPARVPGQRLGAQAALQIGAALVVAAGAVWLAHLGAQQSAAPFTHLWLLPENAVAEAGMDGGAGQVFQVGFTNMESEPASYALRLVAGDQVVAEWHALHLLPGQAWETRVRAAPDQLGGLPLEAELYRDGNLYRWVNWQPDP